MSTNANVGKGCQSCREFLKEYDSVVLACGASNPRDIKAPGRDAKGIYFAVDFLTSYHKESSWILNLADRNYHFCKRKKHVVVIGGGDTGNDCVGTCNPSGLRQL